MNATVRVVLAFSLLVLSACSADSATPSSGAPSTPPETSQAPESTTTVAATTTAAITTTTAAPTGSAQACEGFLIIDDADSDGWGECVITLEGAQQQYYVISGAINGATALLADLRRSAECATYLQANRTFVDQLKAASWPAEVMPELEELVAATEYELFQRDENCEYSSNAVVDEVDMRRANAVFAFRTAIGSPTDI